MHEIENNDEQLTNGADPCSVLDACPYVGKEFSSIEDALEFYNEYALRIGFSVRIATGTKSKMKGESSKRFVCWKEGYSKKYRESQKEKGNSSKQKTPEKETGETRVGCKASLRIRLLEGVWRVSVFVEDHNHPLVTSPSKLRNLRSHRKMSFEVKQIINGMHAQNIAPAKIHEYLGVNHGGKRYLKFKKKDVSNEIASQNRKLVGVDVDSTLVYFQKKQEEDPEFFYAVEVDESGRLKNLFWVDGRARRAFQEFGDVVTFDTTYQTNKYSMPIAPFLGVNHHRMSIFFGIGTLRSEDKAGFVWLFQTWVKAMYGKEPKAIITDQDPAMRVAIKEVLPNTIHRCCQWHVMRKARDHLGVLWGTKPDFEKEMKRIINRSMSVSNFEKGWENMLEKHDMRNNQHLKVMYGQRAEWVPAYFQGVFLAGMSTTQRSESANSLLKIFTHNHTSMYQLALQLEKVVDGVWQKESDEDIKSMSVEPSLSSLFRIEKDARSVYTCKLFKRFKEILKEQELGKVEEVKKDLLYEVIIDYHPKYENWVAETYKIRIDKLEKLVSCSCNGYEFEGLLCSHAIKVMHHVGMWHLPSRYIMKRWCKEANAGVKRSKLERSMDCGESREQEALRFATLKPQMMNILKMASKSRDSFSLGKVLLSDVEQELKDVVGDNETPSREICTMELVENRKNLNHERGPQKEVMILDPPISQCKGKRKPQRFKPPSEAKRLRKCSTCQERGGHNSRTCPLKKVKGKEIINYDDDSDIALEYEDSDGAQDEDFGSEQEVEDMESGESEDLETRER